MQNCLDDFFKKVAFNFKDNKSKLSAFIKEFQNNNTAGKFHVTAEKINCFYKNITQIANEGKGILIYGDYDVDGIFSTSMLVEYLDAIADIEKIKNPHNAEAIEKFRKSIHIKIPTRDDGYGIDIDFCKAALNSRNIDYVITCDNGTHKPMQEIIKNSDYIDKIFIFDHHANGNFDAYPNVINPNKDGKVEISTGILLYRFFEKLARTKKIELPELADLAAFTAISDVASLDSNRDIVEKGLIIINNAYAKFNNINSKIDILQNRAMEEYDNGEFSPTGERRIKRIQNLLAKQDEIKKLSEYTRPLYNFLFNDKRNNQITTKDLSFNAIPKFNAINRTGCDAMFFVYMLLCKELKTQKAIETFSNNYEILNDMNASRKKRTTSATKEALEIVKNNGFEKNPLIYIRLDNLYIGISGLVASKIHEKTGADVIVAGNNKKGDLVFSGRGNNVFNNLDILKNENSDNASFVFGGHLKALGGKILDEEKFIMQLKDAVDKQILIPHEQDKVKILEENYKILPNPITLFEFVELSKILTAKNGGIPYSKNFLVPVIISDDMILNKDDVLAKSKSKDFVSLKLEFANPEKESVESIRFIANSEDAQELLNNSEIKREQMPVFLMELSNNCYDNYKDVFSGRIVHQVNIGSLQFLETLKEKPAQKQNITQQSGIKI